MHLFTIVETLNLIAHNFKYLRILLEYHRKNSLKLAKVLSDHKEL